MKNILYIVNNDSSDTRVYKELKSLSQQFNISFLGINSRSKSSDSFFGKKYCKNFFLINGNLKNPITMLKFIFNSYYFSFKRNIDFIHIVNEQLFFFYVPNIFF